MSDFLEQSGGQESLQPEMQGAEQSIDQGTQEQGQLPAEGQQPAQSDFDPKGWAIKFKGREVYPNDRDHLRNLAQKGYSYETRMAELNKRQQELDAMSGNYQKYSDLDKNLQSNPKFNNDFWQWYNSYQNGGVQGDSGEADPRDAQIAELKEKLTHFDQRFNSIEEERATQTVQSEIKAMRDKYQDEQWDLDDGDGKFISHVLQHAHDNNFPTIEAAYRDMKFDTYALNSRQDALKQAKEAKQKQAQAGVVSSGKSMDAPGPQKVDVSKLSWNEARDLAFKQLGG